MTTPRVTRRLLLIDDDRAQFRLTHAQLRHFPRDLFELDWAGTYEEGMERLLSGQYDACLLDYQLGPRDGLQLLRSAIAQGCRTPVVFLTAETSPQIDLEAMNAGALDYLVKSEITPRILERSLRYAVKLAASFAALRQLATVDPLTGLLNRREFDRILQDEHERAVRFAQPLGLLLLDLDHFKQVNDTHGHPVGDHVLQTLAQRIAGNVRTVDRVARYGGEEFAVVLVQGASGFAKETAERIRAAVAAEPIATSDGRSVSMTVSIGVAALGGPGDTPAGLVAAADKALYAAKAAGRNQVVTAGSAS